MFSRYPILRFILLSIAFYAGLLAFTSFSGLDKSAGNSLRKMGNATFGTFKKNGKVDFQVFRGKNKASFDTHIVLMNNRQIIKAKREARKAGKKTIEVNAAAYDINTWRYALIPFLLMLALILASPVNPKRKIIAILLGILLYGLFVLFRLRMDIAFYFLSKPSLEVVDPGNFGKAWINGFHNVLSQGFMMIGAIFIWLLVTFSWGNIQGVFQLEKKKK